VVLGDAHGAVEGEPGHELGVDVMGAILPKASLSEEELPAEARIPVPTGS
jgi:hypothetical protein